MIFGKPRRAHTHFDGLLREDLDQDEYFQTYICGTVSRGNDEILDEGKHKPFKRQVGRSNDGCGESNSTVPKNSADEKNCADGAKLCTNETEPSASERKIATRETCEHSMAAEAVQAVDENDGKRDLAVAVDGSWQKRGFSSKNGLATVTSVDTGKIDKRQKSTKCHKHIMNTSYHGLSSVKDMQQAIWAIFTHYKLSTDRKTSAWILSPDSDTWCKFKKQNCLGRLIITKWLPVDVVEAMRPVFRDLANPELLKVFTW
ncbi:uncharacterized protein TNCV_509821, partial [Trichonephila clavipes]